MPKIVVFDPLPNPIPPCCPAARGGKMRAVPSVRLLADGGAERGYTLEHDGCDCPSRWVPHDWSKGHAQFITTNQEDNTHAATPR